MMLLEDKPRTPKKQLFNRLDSLLSDLEDGNGLSHAEQIQDSIGWSWKCDDEGIITACDPQVKYILGISAEEFIGKQVNSFRLTPDSVQSFSAILTNGVPPKDIPIGYESKSGDILRTIITLKPLPSLESKKPHHGWQGIVRVLEADISEQDHPAPKSALFEPDTTPTWTKTSLLNPSKGKFSGFLAEEDRVVPVQKILTEIGEESLQFQHLLYQNGGKHKPTVLALPAPYHDGSAKLLLEFMDNQPDRKWSQEELQLVEQVADQLSLALENAQLFERIQAQAEELGILRQVSLELAREQHDLQSVLDIILQRATELLDSQFAAIWLWNDLEAKLGLSRSYPLGDGANDLPQINLGGELPELAFERGRTLIMDEHLPGVDASEEYPSSPAIAVPLVWQSLAGGVLLIGRGAADDPFSPNERHLIELLAVQAAAAIQNARLFDQTQSALAETDLLYKATAELNASESYDDILEVLKMYTVLGEQSREVTINLYDRLWTSIDTPDWYDQVAGWSADKQPVESSTSRFEMDTIPLASQLLNAYSPTIIEDITNDSRLGAVAREMYITRFNAQGLLFSPLVTAGQWIGHVTAKYSQPMHFPETALKRLAAITGQAAFAVQNLRLIDETQRRADELQTAAEIARDTTGTLTLNLLLNRTAELIRERFQYHHTTIYLLDDSGRYTYPSASTIQPDQRYDYDEYRIAVGSNSIIGYVTQVGEHLLVNDINQDPLHLPSPMLDETKAELGIPLKIGDRVIGALDVQSTRVNAFTSNDITVLQILADQIAVAVENARSYGLSLQAMEEMRKADQLKSQFLANMSHELRTPLNSIIGFSRVILKGIDGPINEGQEQDLNAIYSSGQHLLSLINDILDLSKIEAGKMELSFEDKVNLADLIHSVMSTTTGLVKDKPIEIYCEIEENLPTVRADPLKIRQVLLNLISNAAKFTDEGSITIKGEAIKDADGHPCVKISVTDTGKGILPEDQKKLFLPFSQVDASPTRKTGGSGLGLSICRHLIEMHRGSIGVDSKVGVGSSFYFTIPILTIPNKDTKSLREGIKKNILCIDSDADVINIYKRYLSIHGYQVISITDYREAVHAAKNYSPIVITLEIALPGVDGWQVLEDLKTDPETRNIPVIICSIQNETNKAAVLGASGYLLKPVLEDELLKAIYPFETRN